MASISRHLSVSVHNKANMFGRNFPMMSGLYMFWLEPFALGGIAYFMALFLGLTIWRDKVCRPRLFGWSAFTFAASVVSIALTVPLSVGVDLINASSFSPSDEPSTIFFFTSTISCVAGLISICFFFGAIIPGRRSRSVQKPMAAQPPPKHPLDD